MLGVITNFRDWIFTRYDLKGEMEDQLDDEITPLDKLKMENKPHFEFSETFTIFNID